MSNATRQHRWNPANSADTPQEALSRQFTIPGSHYEGPQFCWVWAVAPAGVGFAGKGLGPQYAGDLFVGGSRRFLDNGYLLDFKLNAARDQFAFSDPKLADKVDNNSYKFDIGKGTSFVTGKNFGIATDVETGPDGNLYVVSLSNNAVYMITSKVQTLPPPPAAAPQLVVSPVAITEAPGRKFQGKVATFVDPIAGRAANQFTAVIFWGDGTATSGTVSAGGQRFVRRLEQPSVSSAGDFSRDRRRRGSAGRERSEHQHGEHSQEGSPPPAEG